MKCVTFLYSNFNTNLISTKSIKSIPVNYTVKKSEINPIYIFHEDLLRGDKDKGMTSIFNYFTFMEVPRLLLISIQVKLNGVFELFFY